jgi:hypothetical protein
MCQPTGDLEASVPANELQQLDLAALAALANPRFVVLRAEATLPNQGAGYLYASEGGL